MRFRLIRLIAVGAVAAGIFATAAWALAFSDASYFWPEGVVGKPYSHQLGGRSGCPPYTYKLISGTSLPPGLSVGQTSGTVSGTPTQAGQFRFWVQLGDTGCINDISTAEREFTVTIIQKLTISDAPMPAGLVGQPYTVQLTATGGGSQAWSVSAGSLPPGLTMSPSGLISGTPTALGSFGFTASVADAKRSDTKNLVIDILAPLAFAEPVTPQAEVGVDFEMSLTGSGGKEPYQWAIAGGTLPPGLTLAPEDVVVVSRTIGGSAALAGRAKIAGEPTAAGSYGATIEITDALGQKVAKQVLIRVAGRVEITTQRLRPARAGRLYRAALRIKGGVQPVKWKITSGRLPIGIRFDRKTGILAGTAKRPGDYTIAVLATDKFRVADSVDLTLTVRP